MDKKIREQVKGTLRNSFSISKILGPTNKAFPSEAEWKAVYRNQRKGKHITPAISVCVYTIGPTFIARAFSLKVQDLVNDKDISTGVLPEDLRNSTLLMPDIIISEAGILNLLKKTHNQKGSRSRQNQTCHPSRT